jgi:hypothetical protein
MSKEQRDAFVAGWRECLDALVELSDDHASSEQRALRRYPDASPPAPAVKRWTPAEEPRRDGLRDLMKRVATEHPLAGSHEDDARYNWPARWDALWEIDTSPARTEGVIKALRDAHGMACRHWREDNCAECEMLANDIEALPEWMEAVGAAHPPRGCTCVVGSDPTTGPAIDCPIHAHPPQQGEEPYWGTDAELEDAK